jgi:hypothetical protein
MPFLLPLSLVHSSSFYSIVMFLISPLRAFSSEIEDDTSTLECIQLRHSKRLSTELIIIKSSGLDPKHNYELLRQGFGSDDL